jgi:hypothetical protein
LGGDCLDANQFYTLKTLPQKAYDFGVHLLVVSGCIAGSGDAASCGPDFDVIKGNAKLDSIELTAYTHTTPNDFQVQLAQLSTALASQSVSVAFGALSAPATSLALGSTFGAVGPATPAVLSFDRTDATVYASHGFRVEAAGLSLDLSLASIQALSDPQAVPETFYATRSSFVLLLLGNPADTAKAGGPLTPTTDPGKVLHLLGVPVGQSYDLDGGVDSGAYDASRDTGGKG